jgi:hypothetical protein
VRPVLESLEDRTLLTVTATLDPASQVLTVLADTTKGTTQAQIRLQDDSSVVVNDVRGTSSQTAGTFAVNAVRQIQFQDGSHTLAMGVNNSLISLKGVPLRGIDFPLGANSSVGATAHLALPSVQANNSSNTLDVTGSIDTGGHFSLKATLPDTFATFTVGTTGQGFSLQNGSLSLDDRNGLQGSMTLVVPDLASVQLRASIDTRGRFELNGSAEVTMGGFDLQPHFTIFSTDQKLTVDVPIDVEDVGTVAFHGGIDTKGNFSIEAAASAIDVGGLSLTPSFTLNNQELSVGIDARSVKIPLLEEGGSFTGAVKKKQGEYTFTATASLGKVNLFNLVTLSPITATLTNDGGLALNVSASVSGNALPAWMNNVQFTGQVGSGTLSLTLKKPTLTLFGFTVDNVAATLDSKQLGVVGTFEKVPVVNQDVAFNGKVSASGLNLTATVKNINLINGLIQFDTATVTWENTKLEFKGSTNLSVVGPVTFTATLQPGMVSLGAKANNFQVLGFVTFTNPMVTVTLIPKLEVDVSTTASLAINDGTGVTVKFAGVLSPNGGFKFDGDASLKVAGFTLGTGHLHLGNGTGDSDGIKIGPFNTLPLPVIGPITIAGSYGPGGKFDLRADMHPTPPIPIGPVPVSHFTVGLSNTSLTLGAGVGVSFAGLTLAEANLTGTLYTNSSFKLEASVTTLKVAGFSGPQATLTLTPKSLTLDASVNYIVAMVKVHGDIDFATKTFDLQGVQNIVVAGFTLTKTTFDATNRGAAGLRVALSSTTNLGPYGNASFNGTIKQTSATTYAISATGKGTLKLAGYQLLAGTLDLDNTHLKLTSVLSISILGIQMKVEGDINANGTFKFEVNPEVHFGPLSGNLDLLLTQAGLKAHLKGGVDLTTTVVGYDVGFKGGVDSTFKVDTSGNFEAKASVTMTSVFGGDFTFNLNGELSNKLILIKTSELYVTIWGYEYHPFSDIRIEF